MRMPLVSKFLCYLEAVARRELAGNLAAPSFWILSIPRDVSAKRESGESFWTPPNNFHSSRHFRRTLACRQSHPPARSFS
jgi:hypothetical protein